MTMGRRQNNDDLYLAIEEYGKKFGKSITLWWIDDPKEYRDRIAENRPWTFEEIARQDCEERKKRGMEASSYEQVLAELKGEAPALRITEFPPRIQCVNRMPEPLTL